jgi:hypothetical protein
MKNVIILFSLFMASASFAQTKACFCEIGAQPESQQGAFNTGCKLWLRAQKDCNSTEIVPQNTDYTKRTFPHRISEIAVGYVGHWNDSQELIEYLRTSIVPVMTQKGVTVSVDNTACRSMNDPQEVFDYVRSLRFQKGQRLNVKGNQTISVGKWDTILKGLNFYAAISSEKDRVIYPACKEFQNYNCMMQVQLGEVGSCLDKNNHLTQLRCCKLKQVIFEGPDHYVWQTQDNCAD